MNIVSITVLVFGVNLKDTSSYVLCTLMASSLIRIFVEYFFVESLQISKLKSNCKTIAKLFGLHAKAINEEKKIMQYR